MMMKRTPAEEMLMMMKRTLADDIMMRKLMIISIFGEQTSFALHDPVD